MSLNWIRHLLPLGLLLLAVGCGGSAEVSDDVPEAGFEPAADQALDEEAGLDTVVTADELDQNGTGPLVGGVLSLSSAAFTPGEAIPAQYACDGANISPPLSWSDPPPGTASLALVMDDPDAEPVAGFVWVHWILFNIPADSRTLPEDVPAEAELADGSRHGQTSFNRLGYGGPCPPSGTHEYVFTLYALDRVLELESGAEKEALLGAMDGHIVAQTVLTGLYTR